MNNCACGKPVLHAGRATCGDLDCIKRHAAKFRGTESRPKPRIYRRNCNRCDRHYTGYGRLLCDACRTLADHAGPAFTESVSFGRAWR